MIVKDEGIMWGLRFHSRRVFEMFIAQSFWNRLSGIQSQIRHKISSPVTASWRWINKHEGKLPWKDKSDGDTRLRSHEVTQYQWERMNVRRIEKSEWEEHGHWLDIETVRKLKNILDSLNILGVSLEKVASSGFGYFPGFLDYSR